MMDSLARLEASIGPAGEALRAAVRDREARKAEYGDWYDRELGMGARKALTRAMVLEECRLRTALCKAEEAVLHAAQAFADVLEDL